MAKGICPNLSDPKVKAEFEELVDALGEVQAYAVWDQNGGYSLDKAPNGEPSILFETLLQHNNGNRVNAIQAKAKVYTNSFKAWFGDWVNDPKNSSKVVDENGEPLIVYHGTKQEFEQFSPEETARADVGFFFTSDIHYANQYGKFIIPVYLSIKNPFQSQEELNLDTVETIMTNEDTIRNTDGIIGHDQKLDLNQSQGVEYVTYTNKQIKSVDNSGSFNPNSANIFDREISPLQQQTIYQIDEAMQRFRAQRYDFDSTLDSIRQLITNAVQARIKAIQGRNIQNKTALLVPLEQQLASLKNPNITSLQTIVFCLYDINRTMTAPVNAILQAQKNLREGRDSGFSNLALVQLQQDYFGMYNNVLEEIAKNIFDSNIYQDLLGKESFDQLKTMISNMRTQFAAAKQGITELTTDLAQKTLLQYGIKDELSRTELEEYVSSELITTENDVTTLMRWISAGDKMNDKAARVIFDMVANANNRVRFNTHKFGNRMLRLQQNIVIGEQMRLFEYDSDGKKTGYFIRDRKYGEFMNNLENERKRLKTKYNVPEGQKLPLDKEARTNFNKEMNEWLSNNCERRYTKEYYDAFNSLSQEARDARDAIQFKIYKLLDDVRDNKGRVHMENLTESQWNQYLDYNTQKKQLMSRYYEDGTPKTDMDLQIAQELTDLNKTLHEGMHYVTNMEKFNEAKAEAKKNLTPEEYEKWKKRYTREEISEKFYKQLAQLNKKTYGDEYAQLQEMREDLTKPYRNEYTGGLDVKRMSSQLLGTLKSIDRQMRKIRKNTPKVKKQQQAVEFEDIAEVILTEQYKIDKANALKRGIEFYEAWELTHHVVYYVGGQEVKRPNWYYTRVVPKDKTLINTEAPTREFSEIDPKSEYFNNDFDTNIDEYYQPKSTIYTNKQYYDMFDPVKDKDGNDVATKNKDLWELYKGLLSGMEESNDKITYLTRNNPYRLPQMSGSMYQYMKNDGIIKGFLQQTRQGIVKDTDDVGFVDAPTSRPDGSEQRLIPTYFIDPIRNEKGEPDPNRITNDLVGAVIAYYKMAENFKQKTEIQPDLEVIKMQLANRTFTGKPIGVDATGKKVYKQSNRKEGKDTNVYKFVSKFIDMQEYGEEVKAHLQKISSDSRIGKFFGLAGTEINWSKIALSVKNFGQLIGLGLNLAVGATGMAIAFLQQLGFVANGRYFDFSSFSKAYFNMVSNILGIMHYMHSTTTDNKYVACMQHFEIGTEFKNAYRNSNRIGIINTISRNWAFGIFSFSDFVIKGTLLNSIMNNYRYYNGKFYNKEQFINIIGNKEDANNIWKSLHSTYDIIEIKDGNIHIENKAYAKAFAEVENQISNAARSLAATADGQLTEEQKAQFTNNALGSIIMMFRNYIPNLINERVTMKKQYDYDLGMKREALYRTVCRVIPMLVRDWNSRKSLDSSDIGNLKQFCFEMPTIMLLSMIIKPLLVQAADDDKDDWIINFLALLVTRTGFEYSNQYNPLDLLNTLTSVSSLINIVNPFTNIISWNEMYNMISNNKPIKYGPYKGYTKLERWLWKMTPFKNIIEIQDPALKRKYYEQLYNK